MTFKGPVRPRGTEVPGYGHCTDYVPNVSCTFLVESPGLYVGGEGSIKDINRNSVSLSDSLLLL